MTDAHAIAASARGFGLRVIEGAASDDKRALYAALRRAEAAREPDAEASAWGEVIDAAWTLAQAASERAWLSTEDGQ